jgi:hypothetical protein
VRVWDRPSCYADCSENGGIKVRGICIVVLLGQHNTQVHLTACGRRYPGSTTHNQNTRRSCTSARHRLSMEQHTFVRTDDQLQHQHQRRSWRHTIRNPSPGGPTMTTATIRPRSPWYKASIRLSHWSSHCRFAMAWLNLARTRPPRTTTLDLSLTLIDYSFRSEASRESVHCFCRAAFRPMQDSHVCWSTNSIVQ